MITSRHNPWFRRFRDAATHHQDEILLEGPKAIRDAVGLGWKPIGIAIDRPDREVPQTARVIVLDRRLFAEISDTATSQGMTALFERPRTPLASLFTDGIVAVLDGVQDPGNVGTVIRLAAAFDLAGVALTEGCADPFGPKAIRASAGAVLAVPVCQTTRAELLETVQRNRFELWVAATGHHDAEPPPQRAALVFGSEGQGASKDLLERGKPVSIATSDRVESLNVGTAAAILLSRIYERRRGGTLSAPGRVKEKRNA